MDIDYLDAMIDKVDGPLPRRVVETGQEIYRLEITLKERNLLAAALAIARSSLTSAEGAEK